MGKYSYIGIDERLVFSERIWRSAHDANGNVCDDGFIAAASEPKYLVCHQKSTGVTFVMEYTHDHKPVQEDAFECIGGFSTSVWGGGWEAENIEPLSEEQKSIVAAALKASLCDVKAFDPVTPAGKVAPVRLCPMGAKASREALEGAVAALNRFDSVYPLSFTEFADRPVMVLRAVSYNVDPKTYERTSFRMRITACIPMEVHRVKDFNEMVHDVFGYKREDD